MKVIRDLELKDLVDKYCDYRNKLDDLITGVPMPDPVEGEVHSIGYHDQVLHNGKLKEPFREIDDLEIENTKEREAISYGGTNCGCPDILGNVFTDYHGQD